MGKRLKYTLSKDDRAVIRLAQELGNPFTFSIGMKVRATYVNVPIWFYGRVTRVGLGGRSVNVLVEKSKPYMRRAFKKFPLCFMTEGTLAWIEPYDY